MQDFLLSFAALLIAYLWGAVPFALLAGKLQGKDIRKHGSGNLGATNAIRVLGKPIGLTVFLLDFCKGLGPVLLARTLPQELAILPFACGLAAVLGHIFPVYLRFKGGKGVAAAAGMLIALRWDAALIAFLAFFLTRWFTGFVSLSSIALALAFPTALAMLHWEAIFNEYGSLFLGSLFLACLILFRHKSNLVRIMKGEEPKVGAKNQEGKS